MAKHRVGLEVGNGDSVWGSPETIDYLRQILEGVETSLKLWDDEWVHGRDDTLKRLQERLTEGEYWKRRGRMAEGVLKRAMGEEVVEKLLKEESDG